MILSTSDMAEPLQCKQCFSISSWVTVYNGLNVSLGIACLAYLLTILNISHMKSHSLAFFMIKPHYDFVHRQMLFAVAEVLIQFFREGKETVCENIFASPGILLKLISLKSKCTVNPAYNLYKIQNTLVTIFTKLCKLDHI